MDSRTCSWTSILALATAPVLADSWAEPNPWRREALLQGRTTDYNSERFLHTFSYREILARPATGEDGIRGTVGSVTGDEFFVDMQLQKTLRFDDQRNEAFLRMQRAEDFDGEYSRQLVGFGHWRGDWRLSVAGDLHSDKSDNDIEFELRRQTGDSLLRMVVVLPEAYYNSKSADDGEYTRQPYTLFLHGRTGQADGWQAEAALNLSPRARFDDPALALVASGRQVRAMAQVSAPLNERWRAGLRVEAEQTERDYLFQGSLQPQADDFRRRMHATTLSVTHTRHPLTPTLGIHHLRFEERGWMGLSRGVSGEDVRDQPLAFVGMQQPLSSRWAWRPTLYITRADVTQQQQPDDGTEGGRQRDERQWQGKLALPFQYVVDARRGGVLTLNPTLRLHRAAFGGGNVQLHWPL